MATEFFREVRFHKVSKARIAIANQIIEKYAAQGYSLTIRQLYYQFVTWHGLPNTVRSYKNLVATMSDARLAGLTDWDAIEDRGRVPQRNSQWDSPKELLEGAANQYRLPRWEGQPYYAELWVEKQALAGVLEPLASKFHATLMVNKGYSSQTAMYEASKRLQDRISASGKGEGFVFYIGDHDPSGMDMVRDITERLDMFGVTNVQVKKLALNMDQIRKFKPPPNPANVKDVRYEAYISQYGKKSWEVDALNPETLVELITDAFTEVIDWKVWDRVLAREGLHKAKLQAIADGTDWDGNSPPPKGHVCPVVEIPCKKCTKARDRKARKAAKLRAKKAKAKAKARKAAKAKGKSK